MIWGIYDKDLMTALHVVTVLHNCEDHFHLCSLYHVFLILYTVSSIHKLLFSAPTPSFYQIPCGPWLFWLLHDNNFVQVHKMHSQVYKNKRHKCHGKIIEAGLQECRVIAIEVRKSLSTKTVDPQVLIEALVTGCSSMGTCVPLPLLGVWCNSQMDLLPQTTFL